MIHVGTLEPRKNLMTLIEAFARFRQAHTAPWRLLLVGNRGWYYEPLLARIEHLGLRRAVVFASGLEETTLASLYRQAAFMVYPSLYEGFGIPLVEAMAAGCPLIVSRAGPMPEVVGEAGLFVDPLDIEGFAAAMTRLAGDPALRRDLADRGRKQVDRFSWARTARETLDVLESLRKDVS